MRKARMFAIAMVNSVGLCVLATGCAADRNKDVPTSAALVAQGQKDLAYRAPDDGVIYVYDKSGGNVLYSGRLQRDEMLQVDAMKDRITVDGRTVMDKQIRDHDDINVFFRREPGRDARINSHSDDATIVRERRTTEYRRETPQQ